ncbi:MAG: ABC transporter permease [Pauljensenia sp.]
MMTGVGTLVRLALRRDRVRITAWGLGSLLVMWFSVVAVIDACTGPGALEARAALAHSPGTVVIAGPLFGADEPSIGPVVANELTTMLLVVVAVLSVLCAVRHTRADEEAGRTELVRAQVTARRAPAVAALVAVATLNLVVSATVSITLVGNDLPVADSSALGVSCLLTGFLFGAVAAVTSQLAPSARGASSLAMGVVGLAFAVRAAGDMLEPSTGSWLSWLSPFAWAQQIRAYADLRWWPLALTLAATVVALAVAGVLSDRRDLGSGLLPSRPGPGTANATLLGAGGLARRLLRPAFLSWGTGIVLTAALSGSMARSVEDMLADSPDLAAWMGTTSHDLIASFSTYMLGFLVVMTTAFAVSAVLVLRREEGSGRGALVLVSGVPRTRWVTVWITVVAVETATILLAAALAMGVCTAVATGEWHWVGDLLVAGLVNLPGALVAPALAAALLAWAPRWTPLAWVLIGWSAFVLLLGPVLGLPGWVGDLSPLELTPKVPEVEFTPAPVIALAAVVVVLVLLVRPGTVRRDLLTA